MGEALWIRNDGGLQEPPSPIAITPYLWDLSRLYSTGEVRLTGTGGVGDYDGSGLVDQGDLDLVLLNWGTDGTSPPLGWINDLPVGLVDQAELDKVLLNWGSALSSGAVPEPSSLGLFPLAVLFVGIHWNRSQRKERRVHSPVVFPDSCSSKTLRAMRAIVPVCAFAAPVVLANKPVTADSPAKYVAVNDTVFGGTGGTWATYAAGHPSAFEIAAHEIGHSFAGLADEYFTVGTTYTGDQPQERNVTTGTDKWDRWLGYIDPDHPQLGPIDYYEGGRYRQFGIYRPTRDSRMRNALEPWNAVSREAIIDAIYRRVRPLDDWLDEGEVLVNPQDLWVDAIDANVFGFEWFIDGERVSGARGEMFDVSGLRQAPGEHTVRVRVYDRVLDHALTGDSLDWWRKDDKSMLEQHVEWHIRTTLAGDYNGDGLIEQGDLDLVLVNWGQPALPPPSGWVEDLPVSEISQSHLDQVLLNWGRTPGAVTAVSSIPEPPAAALAVVVLCVLVTAQVTVATAPATVFQKEGADEKILNKRIDFGPQPVL